VPELRRGLAEQLIGEVEIRGKHLSKTGSREATIEFIPNDRPFMPSPDECQIEKMAKLDLIQRV
jgi:hypothetical protein